MTRKPNQQPALTNWQRRALGDLRAQSKNQPNLIKVGNQSRDEEGNLWVEFAITTTDLPVPKVDGLTFKPIEEFVLLIAPQDDQPPTVVMSHHRFIGTPHVLSGFYLCLYLDVSREWNPDVGINGVDGVLHRLWDWMTKATQNDFNPATALYHAVGGVPHVTLSSQAIVVRDLPTPQGRTAAAYLHRRTPNRLDLTYTLQVVLMGLVFAVLSGSGLLDSTVDRGWLAGAVIGGTAIWLVGQVLLTTRRRIPVYDLPEQVTVHPAQGGER